MSPVGAASLAALSPARAAASRQNGARSRGPKSPAGKARAAQNALKHGLRAQKHIVLPEEDAAAFAAFEAALLADLAPAGALQAVLARRIVAAAWRLERAERIEADLFEIHSDGGGNISVPRFRNAGRGLAVVRDGNGARAFDTLLRYRGTTLAELWRALRLLKALQAEAAQAEQPIEPEARRIPGATAPVPAAAEPAPAASARPAPRHPTPSAPELTPSPPRESGGPGAALLGAARPGSTHGEGSGSIQARHPGSS